MDHFDHKRNRSQNGCYGSFDFAIYTKGKRLTTVKNPISWTIMCLFILAHHHLITLLWWVMWEEECGWTVRPRYECDDWSVHPENTISIHIFHICSSQQLPVANYPKTEERRRTPLLAENPMLRSGASLSIFAWGARLDPGWQARQRLSDPHLALFYKIFKVISACHLVRGIWCQTNLSTNSSRRV